MNKDYKISVLFGWQNGNTDLKKEHINGKGYPVVSSGVENTGIIGCTDVDARILPAHTITVDMFGNAYYRDFEYKEVTHARVFTLIPKGFNLDVQIGLYLVSSLQSLTKIFSYNNMCSYAKISDMTIKLPVIKNPDPAHEYTVDDIDWQYMRDRIAELERDRIVELEAYLRAAGLNDYELTMDEEMALKGFFDDKIRWKSFRMSDLGFEISHGRRLTKPNRIPGKIPLITAGESNQGIAEYIGNDWPAYKDAITVDMFGNCFLHEGVCTGDDNIYFFTSDKWDVKEKEFIVTGIQRSTSGKYSYAKQFRQANADELSVEMPINPDGSINREYIYIYILNP